MRALLQAYLPNDDEYGEAFDIFEYFIALAYWHQFKDKTAPLGRFAWRRWEMSNPQSEPILTSFVSALRDKGDECGLFQSGFFEDQVDLDRTVSAFNEWGFAAYQRLRWGRW